MNKDIKEKFRRNKETSLKPPIWFDLAYISKPIIIGAITGDIVGSCYEFRNIRTKEFDLFSERCDFTDDTVMTVAIAKALSEYKNIKNYDKFKKTLIESMHDVGNRYMERGYGHNFMRWIAEKQTEPYNSFGNGSAMRVSPVAWYAKTLKEAEYLAKATAEVTHNHPEGIKGAQAVAGAIFMARTGRTIGEIREYISKYYTIDFTLDDIRETYKFNETCQGSVPQALEAFFESSDFEDAIRNAISIGGDSDTIAAIAGSIAEAYYGVPEDIREKSLSFLDDYLTEELLRFQACLKNRFTI
jgi:type I restriction enzyme M protein